MEISRRRRRKRGREGERERPSSVSPTKHAFSLDCIDSNRQSQSGMEAGRVGWTTDDGRGQRSDKTEKVLAKLLKLFVNGAALRTKHE